jgi:CheY-like chemotaxis protein
MVASMGTAGAANAAAWYALVADDDDDSRTLVASILRHHAFAVCEASDGEELVARYHALTALPGCRVLVVSDIDMPGIDGISATRSLRTLSPELLIVLVTGFTDERTTARAQHAGANAILSKPVSPQGLVRILDGFRSNQARDE